MHHNIKATELTLTPEIKEYVERKLIALEKFAGTMELRADVELQYLAGESRMYRSEVTVHGAERVFRAENTAASLHEAFDISMGQLGQELTRNKKKKEHLFRRGAMRAKEFVRGWRNRF